MKVADFAPAVSESALEAAAQTLAQDGIVRLEKVLDAGAARALIEWLAEEAEWWRVVNRGDKVWDLGPQSIAELETDPTKKDQLLSAVHKGAESGFQFLFDNVRVSEEAAERRERANPVDCLLDAFNGPEWLSLFRTLIGDAGVNFVDGQATRYLPGHFLTAHDDDVEGKNRRAAYVLGLTENWRTEWGGLLMFHAASGDVERALMPRFNAINVFTVPRLHSVSPVAPYAGAARYSVTGWLRAERK